MQKNSKSFEIALSAVACAFAVIFLVIGLNVPFLLMTGYVMACFALMLPLSKQFIWGDVLAYIATVLLVLVMGGMARIFDFLPFILFFGLHPLANFLQLKFHINKWLAFFIKAIWFDATLYIIWRFVFAMTTNFHWVDDYILIVIAVFGSVFFFVYDYLIFKCQIAVNKLIARIKKD